MFGRRAVRRTFENSGGFSSAHLVAFTADKYAPRVQVCQACKHNILCLYFRSLARCGDCRNWQLMGSRSAKCELKCDGHRSESRFHVPSNQQFTSYQLHELAGTQRGRWEGPFGLLPQCTGRALEGVCLSAEHGKNEVMPGRASGVPRRELKNLGKWRHDTWP